LSFSLPAALRRLKPQRMSGTLVPRREDELPFVAPAAESGFELLLDTCVYIDVVQGRTPPEVDEMLRALTC